MNPDRLPHKRDRGQGPKTEQDLLGEAEVIDGHLRTIRRKLLQAARAEVTRSNLTPAQVNLMIILTRHHRLHDAGLTIRDLSQAMGLAQSTVSGIVERLEKKGFIARTVDAADRRYARVVLTRQVKAYIEKNMSRMRLGPILSALARAEPQDRQAILRGLQLLEALLLTEDEPGAESIAKAAVGIA